MVVPSGVSGAQRCQPLDGVLCSTKIILKLIILFFHLFYVLLKKGEKGSRSGSGPGSGSDRHLEAPKNIGIGKFFLTVCELSPLTPISNTYLGTYLCKIALHISILVMRKKTSIIVFLSFIPFLLFILLCSCIIKSVS